MAQEIGTRDLLAEYLGCFDRLIGDKRTGETFGEVVRGIINAGGLVYQRIAAHSSLLSGAKDGGQRVIRFAKGESTKPETDELWLIADPSDLRKPYASEMPDLMQVRDLDGKLVPGYRTLNVVS